MKGKILALIENNIGTRLVLPSHMEGLGYRLDLCCAPELFWERLEADRYDWVIVDAAALPCAERRALKRLARHRKEARILWFGRPPRRSRVPVEASVVKPSVCDGIVAFFSGERPGIHTSPPARPAGRRSGRVRTMIRGRIASPAGTRGGTA